MTISTSFWGAQHPNVGQNIQQIVLSVNTQKNHGIMNFRNCELFVALKNSVTFLGLLVYENMPFILSFYRFPYKST